MKRYGILTILCLALGAVRAEAQTQPSISLLTQTGPAISGSAHPCLLLMQNVPTGSDLYFLLGDPGSSTIRCGNQMMAIPLTNIWVMGSGTSRGGSAWYGKFPVPADPSLIGWTPQLTAIAALPNATFCVAPLVPFGPIIEDSIQ